MFSHVTACALHGLPLPSGSDGVIWVTRPRSGGGHRRQWLNTVGRSLPDGHVVEIDGHAVTSLARTVIDMACEFGFPTGLMVGDAAAARGLTRTELAEVLESCSAMRRGRRHAVAVAEAVDPRVESPGESLLRAIFKEHGIPEPVLQFEFTDSRGVVVIRVDFAWPRHGVIAEYDGRTKYDELARPGEKPVDVLMREKQREGRLTDSGWRVVRFTAADLRNPERTAARMMRALSAGPYSGRRAA